MEVIQNQMFINLFEISGNKIIATKTYDASNLSKLKDEVFE